MFEKEGSIFLGIQKLRLIITVITLQVNKKNTVYVKQKVVLKTKEEILNVFPLNWKKIQSRWYDHF